LTGTGRFGFNLDEKDAPHAAHLLAEALKMNSSLRTLS
jgi:hypothetical protein